MGSNTLSWFDDLPVLGQLPAREAAPRLLAMEALDDRQAQELERRGDARLAEIVLPARARPEAWQHTSHACGFLPLAEATAAGMERTCSATTYPLS